LEQDPIEEFANGLKDFPSHKDDPSKIYKQLMDTAKRKDTVSVGVQTNKLEPFIKHFKDYTDEELKLENMDLSNKPPDQFWKKYFEPLQQCPWFPKS